MKIIDKLEESSSNPVFLALLVGFFAGIIFGFIASPVKKGIAIGSYNGCENKISDSYNEKECGNKISDYNKAVDKGNHSS